MRTSLPHTPYINQILITHPEREESQSRVSLFTTLPGNVCIALTGPVFITSPPSQTAVCHS